MNLNQITLPACNIDESVSFYEALGLKKIVSNGAYARFECPQGHSTLSVEKVDRRTLSPSAVTYFEVDNLKGSVDSLEKKGIKFDSGPTDEEWLWSEARLTDPSGNVICIYSAGGNRKNPPWRLKS